MDLIYRADDGKEFATQKECVEYETTNSKAAKYWVILNKPDTTETGYCQRRTYVKTIWQGFPAQQGNNEEMILMDFCYKEFGKKTAWVQGVAPCPNWKIIKITKQEFEKHDPIFWGGVKTHTEKIVLGIGNRKKINIIEREVI